MHQLSAYDCWCLIYPYGLAVPIAGKSLEYAGDDPNLHSPIPVSFSCQSGSTLVLTTGARNKTLTLAPRCHFPRQLLRMEQMGVLVSILGVDSCHIEIRRKSLYLDPYRLILPAQLYIILAVDVSRITKSFKLSQDPCGLGVESPKPTLSGTPELSWDCSPTQAWDVHSERSVLRPVLPALHKSKYNSTCLGTHVLCMYTHAGGDPGVLLHCTHDVQIASAKSPGSFLLCP